MSNSTKFWSFQIPRIQIQSNLAQIGYLIFYSNSIPNFENPQWGKVFLIKFYTRTYFIWKYESTRRPSLTISNLNGFENIGINQKGQCAYWTNPLAVPLLLCSESTPCIASCVALPPPTTTVGIRTSAPSSPMCHPLSSPSRNAESPHYLSRRRHLRSTFSPTIDRAPLSNFVLPEAPNGNPTPTPRWPSVRPSHQTMFPRLSPHLRSHQAPFQWDPTPASLSSIQLPPHILPWSTPL
jgi:hypothetical protein